MIDEVFTIKARRCKRCGGLLTSNQGIREGYGPCCLRKMKLEAIAEEEEKNQYSLFGGKEGDDTSGNNPIRGRLGATEDAGI